MLHEKKILKKKVIFYLMTTAEYVLIVSQYNDLARYYNFDNIFVVVGIGYK